MPEGSLVVNIGTLRETFTGVQQLLGEPGSGGATGSGLAGASSLVSVSPAARVETFRNQLTEQLPTILEFDAAGAVSQTTGLLTQLRTGIQAPPTAALTGFEQQIRQTNATFSGNVVQQLQQALEKIRGISEGIPQDRTAIASALLDQMLRILGSLEGPEAAQIRRWIESVQEQHRVLMPLIEQAQASDDPAALVVQVVQRSLDSLLDALGFEQVRRLIAFLDDFLGNALPADLTDGITAAFTTVSAAYTQTFNQIDADFPDFRDTAMAAVATVHDLKQQLRPLMSLIRQIANARILQPNALENFLRQQMEAALTVQVQDVRRIDDPFQALFDRIDSAIEGVDLSIVRTEILDFFTTTQQTIEQVNIAAIGTGLQEQLGRAEGTVQELQQSVTELLAQLRDFFANLIQQARSLASGVGDFQADGSFQFRFEQDLRGILTSARTAIGGDPANPTAPSLAGSLSEFQTSINQFLSQISGLLEPVEGAITTAKDTAVTGITNFTGFLNDLNIADLMQELQQKIQEILDALGTIDFGVVVDPVIGLIEENTEKLRSINPESLNSLLREALKVALDVIIQIDFTVAISNPLKDEFAQVKAIPQQAIALLQQQYENAIGLLDALKPDQLLSALFSAFDTIAQAIGSLNITSLLQPLDQLHQQFLQQPLAQLRPSVLVAPIAQAFQETSTAVSRLKGREILNPLITLLDQLKASIASFNITGAIDELLAAVESVKQDLRDIRPSQFLQPLVAGFAQLEGELDRFKPSVVFQPVVELATPLLQFLETVQQQTVTALHQMFQVPLQLLERLQPEALSQQLQQQLDGVIRALTALNLPARYNQLKGQYFDLQQRLEVQGDEMRLSIAVQFMDPDRLLADLFTTYDDLLLALQRIREAMQLPNLSQLYTELRDRLLGLLPPYARELLNPETFKRVMRLADPTRFLQELDQRFTALKNKLIPIRPQELVTELDQSYAAVLDLVEGLQIEASLNQVKTIFDRIKGIVTSIRIDFLAGDLDQALSDLRGIVAALDPTRFVADLDAIHQEVEQVVANTVPSVVLAGLQTLLNQVQQLLLSVNPRTLLAPPLNQAWQLVEDALTAIDFTVILSPLVGKLDELEESFELSLGQTEQAFDQMLGAARGALGGGGSASISIGGGSG